MFVVFRVSLLLLTLLSCTAAAPDGPEDCDLPQRVKYEDLHKVMEVSWVLVEGFTDYPAGVQLLSSANSSLLEMNPTEDNNTILFIERNIVTGKCLVFRVNMSAPDPETSNHTLVLVSAVQEFDGKVGPYDDQGRADVYQSCPDCLLIIYHGVFEGTPGRMLLIYRREGKHLDDKELKAAQHDHRKTAECLKFMVPSHFKYDGKAAEFCLEKKEEEKEA